MTHFYEPLQKRHNYRLFYTVARHSLQVAGVVAKNKRGGSRRRRQPLPGMLLFQDGSPHRWIASNL